MSQNTLKIQDVSKEFIIDKEKREILNHIDLEVKQGEFISIVGASGCGKSTLLRIIAGLEQATSGAVLLNGEPFLDVAKKCKMAFQEARLLPWWNVEKNIGFGLDKSKSNEEKKELISHYIKLVGLEGFEKALPKELSGGMQQRVSIARALIGNPEILLLDEPFGALDALTRINMQKEILRVWEQEKKTMILVTHDIDEAVYLSDRVIVLSERPGEIRKIVKIELGRPRNRGDEGFTYYKGLIYNEFFSDEKPSPEYAI